MRKVYKAHIQRFIKVLFLLKQNFLAIYCSNIPLKKICMATVDATGEAWCLMLYAEWLISPSPP